MAAQTFNLSNDLFIALKFAEVIVKDNEQWA